MRKILIIDDEKAIRYSLKDIIEYEGYEVVEAEDGAIGLRMILENDYDMVFCDIKMPKLDGIEVLEKTLNEKYVKFCMISGHGTISTAVECLKKGAVDYIEKPIDLNKLLKVLKDNLSTEQENINQRNNKPLQKKDKPNNRAKSEGFHPSNMIGNSPVMKEMYSFIEKVGMTDARILITGANGTGKELVAKALHNISPRKDNSFVEVNCAAIPAELIESELFGHEKGSFTSAIKQRKGNFEIADKGTLFLDEIGDMSLSAQAKVLRALQENKITRVGGEKDILIDVRVIAATNKNLKEEIEKGNFREDLYHRLSVIVIKVPDLKERLEDIPLLVDSFLDNYASQMNIPKPKISSGAINRLQKMNWSGNVRELKNITERLAILCDGEIGEKDVEKYG
ncbi:MAG: sigma-54 dependent transcriptional regulator [Bacteroidales bacterium]|jgi:DNA-binding NtrC family response regulator|nr:sigma-54 dependent transcriptional regulator [Bacteroidales bacterium]MDD4703006.1 sigma-54 dependent transcriptional regulator [Bacteroidales bacterium]MDX9797560.1 sigma-54 dependent transcriptional regulator [Bacteroidales bacterium]